jgi:HK97 family phage prohead protease
MTELLTRRLALAPRTLDEQERTVEAIASTGAGVPRRDTAGAYEERLALSAIDPATLHGVPVLNAHRQGSIADSLGVVTAARIEDGKLVVTIKLSQRSDSIVQDIKDGIIRGISIGYQVEGWRESVEAGRRIKTAIRWSIREVSLVPVPADPGATIRSGADMPPAAPGDHHPVGR